MTRRPKAKAGTRVARKGTVVHRVHAALREMILSLELPPGLDLDEAAVAARFKVSRTPVREAFVRLESERLVTLLPNRGAKVAELSLTSVRQFFEALSLTQRAVGRWAALRAGGEDLDAVRRPLLAFEAAAAVRDGAAMASTNREFHLAVAAAARNAYVTRLYGELLDEGMRLSRLAVLYDEPSDRSRSEHLDAIIRDHRDTVAALEAGDADRAEEIGGRHADLFRGRILDYLRGSPADLVPVEARPARLALVPQRS